MEERRLGEGGVDAEEEGKGEGLVVVEGWRDMARVGVALYDAIRLVLLLLLVLGPEVEERREGTTKRWETPTRVSVLTCVEH